MLQHRSLPTNTMEDEEYMEETKNIESEEDVAPKVE